MPLEIHSCTENTINVNDDSMTVMATAKCRYTKYSRLIACTDDANGQWSKKTKKWEQKLPEGRNKSLHRGNCLPKIQSQNSRPFLSATMHRKTKSKSKSDSKFKHRFTSAINSNSVHLSRQSNIKMPVNESQQLQPQPLPQSSMLKRSAALLREESSTPMLMAEVLKDDCIPTNVCLSSRKRIISNSVRLRMLIPLPTLGATSLVTFLTVICIETVLLSTMSSCAKTFYMHWNTSNSIFRIDNTDHIIDVNKGNLAFEFDQVHIICPVYEPGAFENETEKYIIYNVSKVEYETCRITNADPRVIAICDKPQKLMFFTITFRPFTPQPGGLEFLPGNDYYFISTSSKDDLYRRIGGRCSTNNMKVVFKVCCAEEEINKTASETTLINSMAVDNVMDNTGIDVDLNLNIKNNHVSGTNPIGMNNGITGLIPSPANANVNGVGIQLMPINGIGSSINSNTDQFKRISIQRNAVVNNAGSGSGTTLGHNNINMLPPGGSGIHVNYPGHHHIQTGIRINNVPTQQYNQQLHTRGNNNVHTNDNFVKHPNEVVKNEELTYNSGSTLTSGSHIVFAFIWISSSLRKCDFFINIILYPFSVITFNYLIEEFTTYLNDSEEEVTILVDR